MDGHNLLNLNYEEAMDLLRTSGAEVEILLSQLSTDKRVFVVEEEVCDNKVVEKSNVFHSPIKRPDQQDLKGVPCRPCVEHDTGSERTCMLHPEPSSAMSVEDSSLNNIQCGMAIRKVSGSGKSDRLSIPVATHVTSKRLQCGEKCVSLIHNCHDATVRAACCVLHAKDD
jgi:hypothetical protein